MVEAGAFRAIARNRATVATLLGAAILVVVLVVYLGIDRAMRNAALEEARSVGEADAALLSQGFRSELEKFSLLPLVLAQDPQVRAAMANGSAADFAAINVRLERLALQTGAAAIYLTDTGGNTHAASNWQLPTSFVGSNYGFRRYFSAAMEHGSATQFALGTVSRRPGLYIAQRIDDGLDKLGVVALKVEFDSLEARWRSATAGVFVTDKEGVVLVTSKPAWRFHTIRPQDAVQRDAEADKRQFGLSELPPMPSFANDLTIVGSSLIETQQPIAPTGWDLHLLTDAAPLLATAKANARLALTLGLVIVALMLTMLFIARRQRAAREEAQISDRTAMLRDQLHQANRLAILGQVTAGVGHEIRQPIAAISVFAENGSRLIAHGKTAAAQENFGKIVGLTENIGKITDELLRFSRRTPSQPRDVPLGEVIEGALLLLGDRIGRLEIGVTLPDAAMMRTLVRGEHVGLEQVLVNLLQNAIDATGARGKIDISIVRQNGQCLLTVADNGPGMTPEQQESLFQPFVTSKENGLGLGLVISRNIMRGLGGDLKSGPSNSGAVFTMVVPLA
ncbi:MAG: sensor histidine kinase [Alphaproteobacteria bacterium]|nr:MAG: sensor histidine kinase [Alphaproteobacteria bacterium]